MFSVSYGRGSPCVSLPSPGLQRGKSKVLLWVTWIVLAPKSVYFLEINHLVWPTPQIKFMRLFPNLTMPGSWSPSPCQTASLRAHAAHRTIPTLSFMLSHTSEVWRQAECLLFWDHLKPGMQRVPSHFQVSP